MKPTLLILAVFSFALAACQNVSVVSNRDDQGRYKIPTCPKHGVVYSDSATVYRCPEGDYGVSTWNEGSSTEAPQLSKSILP